VHTSLPRSVTAHNLIALRQTVCTYKGPKDFGTLGSRTLGMVGIANPLKHDPSLDGVTCRL